MKNLVFLFINSFIYSQDGDSDSNTDDELEYYQENFDFGFGGCDENEFMEEGFEVVHYEYENGDGKWEGCQDKVIRLNFHFILREDGEGNFTETTNDLGTNYNGYDVANDLVDWLNERSNVQLNIPQNNNIPVEPFKYSYMLDAVYFHRNGDYYEYGQINDNSSHAHLNIFGRDHEEVINIYFTHTDNSGTVGGYASSLNPDSKLKFTEIRNVQMGWMNNITGNFPFDWFLHGTGVTLKHEIGHLLTLSHTVRWNSAARCPTILTHGNVNTACQDNCDDTPTAWDIADTHGVHPACGWGGGSQDFCSNNLMDYSGTWALSPCQLENIHGALNNGMVTYRTCYAIGQNNNIQITDFDYPQIGYYGNNIEIGDNSIQQTRIEDNEEARVYYNHEVIMSNFEASDAIEFEVILNCRCD